MSAPAPTGTALSAITPTDHRALIWIASIICLIFTVFFLAIRIFIRRRNLDKDDYLLFGSTTLAFIDYALIFAATRRGLGESTKDLTPGDVARVGQIFLASEAVFVITVCGAKCVVVLFLRRLLSRDMRRANILCWIVLGTQLVWGLGALLAALVSCSAASLLTTSLADHCPSQYARWVFVAIFDAATEIAILLLAVSIVWPLHMAMRQKLVILAAFGFRLVCPVLMGLHAYYINDYVGSSDIGVGIVSPAAWQQFVMCYALISATIPGLNGFLRNFNTSLGAGMGYTQHPYHVNSKGYDLTGLKNVSSSSGTAAMTPHQDNFRPDRSRYVAEIGHEQGLQRNSSSGSGVSQHPIIQQIEKNVQYRVDYEPRVQTPRL